MTRKRGKTRFSSGVKRAKRYALKYAVDPLTHRAKKLLPVMYPQMRQALINWDYLETLLFPKFEELGIPLDEYAFYLAWAKRKASMGVHFYETTQQVEFDILTGEFVTRGLQKDLLNQLEPLVDYWISLMKGELEDLVCETYNENYHVWDKHGVTPYLGQNDGDTNSISKGYPYGAYDGDYTFQNGSGKGDLKEAKLYLIGALKYGSIDAELSVQVKGYIYGKDPPEAFRYYTWKQKSDIGYVRKEADWSAELTTWERVNNFFIDVRALNFVGTFEPEIWLTQAYLRVTHT